MRTQEEIQQQIEGLRKERETLPPKSFFGDPNWKIIDAQIAVLEGKAKPSDYEAEFGEDYDSAAYSIYNATVEAEDWLKGTNTDNLYND